MSSSTYSSNSAAQIVVNYSGIDDGTTSLIIQTSSLAHLSTSVLQIVVEFDEGRASSGASGKSMKKLSKGWRIDKKSKKAWKVWKICSLEERLPKYRSSINKELELPLELWQFFRLFLLGPEAPSIPFLNQLSTRQSEWSCWCFVTFFPNRKKIFELNTQIIYPLWRASLCTKFLFTSCTSSLRSILKMPSGRRRLSLGSGRRNLMAKRMSKTMSCASPSKLKNLLSGNTMGTCSCSRYLLIVAKTSATIWSLSSSTGWLVRRTYQWILWRDYLYS